LNQFLIPEPKKTFLKNFVSFIWPVGRKRKNSNKYLTSIKKGSLGLRNKESKQYLKKAQI